MITFKVLYFYKVYSMNLFDDKVVKNSPKQVHPHVGGHVYCKGVIVLGQTIIGEYKNVANNS